MKLATLVMASQLFFLNSVLTGLGYQLLATQPSLIYLQGPSAIRVDHLQGEVTGFSLSIPLGLDKPDLLPYAAAYITLYTFLRGSEVGSADDLETLLQALTKNPGRIATVRHDRTVIRAWTSGRNLLIRMEKIFP